MRHAGYFQVRASDTSNRHLEALIEVQLMDSLTECAASGHNYALVSDTGSFQDEIFVAAFTYDALELFESRRGSNDEHAIIAMNDHRIGSDDGSTAIAHARDSHTALDPRQDAINANPIQVGVSYDQRATFEGLCSRMASRGKFGCLARSIDAKDYLQEKQCTDDAKNCRRVSHRIRQCGHVYLLGSYVREG